MIRRKLIPLIFVVLIGFVLLIAFYVSRWKVRESGFSATTLLPGSNIEIGVPVGYKPRYWENGENLKIQIPFNRWAPTIWIFPLKNEKIDELEDFNQGFFTSNYSSFEKLIINGLDVYVSRYTGDLAPESVTVAKAIIIYEKQGFSVEVSASPQDLDKSWLLIEAMLNSLQIVEGK
jgi:hypothetical protein